MHYSKAFNYAGCKTGCVWLYDISNTARHPTATRITIVWGLIITVDHEPMLGELCYSQQNFHRKIIHQPNHIYCVDEVTSHAYGNLLK